MVSTTTREPTWKQAEQKRFPKHQQQGEVSIIWA